MANTDLQSVLYGFAFVTRLHLYARYKREAIAAPITNRGELRLIYFNTRYKREANTIPITNRGEL